MNNGRVDQFGSPRDLLRNPATTFVAGFLGTPPANILPVTQAGGMLTFAGVPLAPASIAPGRSEAQLLYRAQKLSLAPTPGPPTLAATFAEAAPIAGQTMVTLMVEGIRLTAMADGYFTATPGDPLHVRLDGDPEAVFDLDGRRISA